MIQTVLFCKLRCFFNIGHCLFVIHKKIHHFYLMYSQPFWLLYHYIIVVKDVQYPIVINLSDKMLRLDKTLFVAVQYPCEILPSEQLTLFLFFKFPRILVIQCINRIGHNSCSVPFSWSCCFAVQQKAGQSPSAPYL